MRRALRWTERRTRRFRARPRGLRKSLQHCQSLGDRSVECKRSPFRLQPLVILTPGLLCARRELPLCPFDVIARWRLANLRPHAEGGTDQTPRTRQVARPSKYPGGEKDTGRREVTIARGLYELDRFAVAFHGLRPAASVG